MKTNPIVLQYQQKVKGVLADQKVSVANQTQKFLSEFQNIKLVTFAFDNPYEGEMDNTIFFTYSDHYHANSGTWMSVGQLHHPHSFPEDRGYIKGVATDLMGYLCLRKAKNINHNINVVLEIGFPKFKSSKNSTFYSDCCNETRAAAIAEMDAFVQEQKNIMSAALKEITGCSLIYYVESI